MPIQPGWSVWNRPGCRSRVPTGTKIRMVNRLRTVPLTGDDADRVLPPAPEQARAEPSSPGLLAA